MTLYARIRSGRGTLRTGYLDNNQERIFAGPNLYEVDEDDAISLQASHPGIEIIEIRDTKKEKAKPDTGAESTRVR